MDEDMYDDGDLIQEDYNDEPSYHSYRYNAPQGHDDYYEVDQEEE